MAIATQIITAIFSNALSQTKRELHSHKKGLIDVFKSALGMFANIEIPSVNSGITNPLLVVTSETKREKVCCLVAI